MYTVYVISKLICVSISIGNPPYIAFQKLPKIFFKNLLERGCSRVPAIIEANLVPEQVDPMPKIRELYIRIRMRMQ